MKIEHPKELLKLPNGEIVEAVAPVIISASRATDLPAFYAKWFMNRLKAGYSIWRNPFNHVKSYISFSNVRAIVFWSKNPAPLIPFLKDLNEKKINYYFQFTLNDYEKEHIEPGIPDLKARIDTFNELSDLVGKERIIWRFDPIIMLPNLNPRDIMLRIWNISKKIEGKTSKLVFSFADISNYIKVQKNLLREGLCRENNISNLEPTNEQISEFAVGLSKIKKAWAEKGWEFDLGTCAEEIDLSRYGIKHNKCVDPDLMKRIFSNDEILMNYLKYGELQKSKQPEQLDLFDSLNDDRQRLTEDQLKDKGQRKECGCIISKDIGFYNTCPHGCTYCYANTSWKSANNNYEALKRRNMISESIKFESKQ